MVSSGHVSSSRWQRVRLFVLARDGGVCQVRGPRCTLIATDCGHVVAYIDGGGDDPANLRAECAPCNRGAGATLGNARRRLGRVDLRW